MGHLPDQTPHRVARKSGISIKRDDVTHIVRNIRHRSVRCHEGGILRTAQQSVQFVELATLALPPNPALLAFIPDPASVQQQKAVAARRRAIAPIQACNAFDGDGKQRLIVVSMLAVAVRPIRQQREM